MPENSAALKNVSQLKKMYTIKTVLKSCYFSFGGALISINFMCFLVTVFIKFCLKVSLYK